MFKNEYGSKLLADAVESLASLPGIGRRSALRLALHLLSEPVPNVERFASSIVDFRRNIHFCPKCHMLSDDGSCAFCDDASRDRRTVCVVESHADVLSIENTGQYHGLYHVLGGIISPIDGVGPGDLTIKELGERVAAGEVEEVILALSTSMEGETTAFYISRQLAPYNVKMTAIAR
ncbi:MAG: recombination protein RecR, partial [Bacteroidales bacterium]|nr:recombination protein RecR [Bacteroidales bacterium]